MKKQKIQNIMMWGIMMFTFGVIVMGLWDSVQAVSDSATSFTFQKAGTGTGTVTVIDQSTGETWTCDKNCSEKTFPYREGHSLQFEAKPAAGSVFGGWQYNGMPVSEITYVVPADRITAIFQESNQIETETFPIKTLKSESVLCPTPTPTPNPICDIDVTTAQWHGTDITTSSFNGTDITTSSFSGTDITTSSFNGADVATVSDLISGGTFQAGYGPERGFDDNLSYGFSAPSNPSVNYVGQDFGVGNARNIGLIKIYGSSYSFGLRARFQYSDDGVSWSDTNLTNINVPQGSGWHTLMVGDYGAHRYWRLVEVSGYAGFQAGEVEMFDRNTIWGLSSGGTFQTGYGPERGFDDNSSYGFSAPSNPSVNYVGQDFGSGNAKNIGLIKIYGSPYSYGLRATLQYSDDGVSWSDTNLININVPQGSGWHTLLVGDYGAHRYWRLVEVSGYAGFQAGEVEMFKRGEC